jgi:hypothetical protein
MTPPMSRNRHVIGADFFMGLAVGKPVEWLSSWHHFLNKYE